MKTLEQIQPNKTLVEFVKWANTVGGEMFGSRVSAADVREYIALRNLIMIGQRNNWPAKMFNLIMPSNQR